MKKRLPSICYGASKCSLSVLLVGSLAMHGFAYTPSSAEGFSSSARFSLDRQMLDTTVTGTVVDSSGQPLPGVTITVQGTTIGTVTDLDGRYTINAPDGGVLVFSFIGFERQAIEVGGKSIINVTLNEDTASLDEVVVIGYGT